jgi:hypothetical protein
VCGGYEYGKAFNFIFNVFTSQKKKKKNYSTPLHRKNYKTLIIVNRKNKLGLKGQVNGYKCRRVLQDMNLDDLAH